MKVKLRLITRTPRVDDMVMAPKRLDGGRSLASERARPAKGSVKAMVTTQKPSMKTQHHSDIVTAKYAVIICQNVST